MYACICTFLPIKCCVLLNASTVLTRHQLLDPPANRPPPRIGGRDGRDNAGDNFGEDNESRNPVNFGDIPFADIGFFEDILRSEADAVVRVESINV